MRRSRNQLSRKTAKSKNNYFFVRLAVLILVVFIVALLAAGYIWNTLRNSDYFRVSAIIARDVKSSDFSYLMGKNIFDIDLNREAKYILQFYPECNNVRLVRILPNRIFVDFVKRKPAAVVRLYKYFTVDEDGVFLAGINNPQDQDLTLITGLETKIFGPKPGKKYNNRELLFALDIIKEAKKNRILKNYKIAKINIPSCADTILYLTWALEQDGGTKNEVLGWSQPLEVKFGEDRVKEKISLLSVVIMQAKNDLQNIGYADIRFNEPVIKLKENKNAKK
ncbi:MAG: hypothetical protein HY761_03585 [Candidatus Omnitrophica bacterium]|nr:hypothetical protein [Candidatus Omnitrophota bacterium]